MIRLFTLRARQKARKVSMILMDVDGTLTDGKIFVLPDGQEVKGYHVHDGLGIFLARMAGLKIGIITGKTSKPLEIRAERLGLDEFHQGILDKKSIMLEIATRHQLLPEELAFIGDDLGDLEVMKAVGFPAAVANAHPVIKRVACFISRKEGGQGAVREIIEFILKAQGRWEQVKTRASEIKNRFQNS